MSWFKSFWKALTTPLTPERREFGEGLSFTPRAQQVLSLARQEADRLRHQFVGTEHLLLGLTKLQGCAVNVLGTMRVDLEAVRREVERLIPQGPDEKVSGTILYTPRVKKVLALAAKEAKALDHKYVGTEHILLGLLREGDGLAARVLKELDLDLNVTRQYVLKELDPNYTPTPENAAVLQKPELQKSPETIDISKRYDVYCREGEQEVVYRNALFKGTKTLLPKRDHDFFSEYIELEQSDGRTIFITRSTVMKFCEHGITPGSEPVSNPKG